ncbi:hypothetical protein [Micromonospora maritima]|uniref:hypothetical protein n=1 Tax=Micromonospora maritima TaxID=986711 RepID=UPI00157BDDAB|nr:hypothetical protein [Micromonospora maritima]
MADKTPEPDRHVDPRVPARAPRELQDAARRALPEGKVLSQAVVAFLHALVADPERALALLRDHWPPEKKGRPRTRSQGTPDE